jgi:Fur family peroxide stress response transcriptional regulator
MYTKTLKYSRQREALLDILKNTKQHTSAEWLYQEMKKDFPNVSLATVYRNLNLLLGTKQIIRIDIGSGTEHYDADCKEHYHFVCRRCASITDVYLPPFTELNKKAEELNGGVIDSHSLIFYGICKNCKKADSAFN